jgi:hypothetical protein
MANIIAADDGPTVLIDPVAVAQRGTALQDELCLRHLHAMTQGRCGPRFNVVLWPFDR